jgi:ABC-type molybdenum transport system ATPase subunit/photorepair protein PhrA
MIEYYSLKKSSFKARLDKIQNQLNWVGRIRFFIFCVTLFFVYFFLGDANYMMLSGGIGGSIFLFFINLYSNLKNKKQLLRELVCINSIELNCLEGDYLNLETGEEFIETAHFYSYDVDLFGKGSFFQFINRTSIKEGKLKLAKLLTSNNIENIKTKQNTIKELVEKIDWRQQFSATANLIKVITPVELTLKWIEKNLVSLPKTALLISNLFSVITLVIFIGICFDFLVFAHLTLWIFVGLGVSGFYFKKVNIIYENTTKARATFNQYYRLLELIEKENYTSKILKNKLEILNTKPKPASEILKIFSKIIDALDQRNNLFFGFIGNSLFLWDLRQASKVEKWISIHKENVRKWFEVVAFFDSQNSLANFTFNHSNFIFPEIRASKTIIEATNLGHPLIENSKRIPNDYSIDSKSIFIVTGSNMAGKSTFLRSVSLSVVMANIGLPVCASKMKYRPVKLITSMRTSDSLTNNTSYFFSELKRLRLIVEALEKEHYFVVLDEILKGTNSIDKAEGAKKFLEKLMISNATGLIATHDLSLCSLADTYSKIHNCYFDAEIIKDELYFDYKLKCGICKNRNASFLLKKMKII